MSLFSILLVLLLIYFLYKPLKNIFNAIGGQTPRQENTTTKKAQNTTKDSDRTESKNRIIMDDEGEYVDFEEIKNGK